MDCCIRFSKYLRSPRTSFPFQAVSVCTSGLRPVSKFLSQSLQFPTISNSYQVTRPLKSHKDRLQPPVFGPHLPLKIRPNYSIKKQSSRRISAILRERKLKRLPKSRAAKSTQVPKQVIPLPQFSPAQTLGRNLTNWEKPYKPISSIGYKKKDSSTGSSSGSNKPRLKSRFIDDSAIEINSDGESVASRESTPDFEAQPRPVGQFAIPRIQPLIKPVICKFCFVECSGPRALEFHQASNKCKNRRDYQLKHKCFDCNRLFETTHDLERHIFSKH